MERATVYGRMIPYHKTQLVEQYKIMGFTVGMVGDGANDAGALNAADVIFIKIFYEFSVNFHVLGWNLFI